MAVADKIKALLNIKSKKIYELAEYFEMSPQVMRNKLNKDSFSSNDLIKVAEFLDCNLAFIINDTQKIYLEKTDLKDGE